MTEPRAILCMPHDIEAKIAIAIKDRLQSYLHNGITADIKYDKHLHDYERNTGLNYIEHLCSLLEAGKLPGVN